MRDSWGLRWYYRQKGFYYAQVKRYFDTIGPDQVSICLHEDLRNDPFGMLRDLYRFLGVDDSFIPDASIEHNPSGIPKNGRLYTGVRALTARNPVLVERFIPAGLRGYVKSRIFTKPSPFPPEARR